MACFQCEYIHKNQFFKISKVFHNQQSFSWSAFHLEGNIPHEVDQVGVSCLEIQAISEKICKQNCLIIHNCVLCNYQSEKGRINRFEMVDLMETDTNARLWIADLIKKGTRVTLSFKFPMLQRADVQISDLFLNVHLFPNVVKSVRKNISCVANKMCRGIRQVFCLSTWLFRTPGGY